jgi:hypothetical protein
VGVPATVEHAGNHSHITSPSSEGTDQVNARHIAETVEVFPFMLRLIGEIYYIYGCIEVIL